ncbi:MAG: N-acetylneuraminate synthase [Candidatus Muiribacterium halophilum]|uniref:N-acetylneuraminate synthase n=1 Tax=Muiribacterium halophilum TaxID=2053465 RepID=A0A2N5Z9Z1_MUIH1|nr:MAG: N-acetylneuraminate synthase [Candidatus Muirbacterium halophilum]
MSFEIGNRKISEKGLPFIIAEIGNNHQGELDKAVKLIQMAAASGADCVKFQKRDNKALYTEAYYNRLYDNENSFGETYVEHRDFLEFNKEEYRILMKTAKECGVEFMCTAFDFNSVDFLEDLNIIAYKIASGDLTSIPLIKYIAEKGKPMIISTGASTLEEIKIAYKTAYGINKQVALLHCVASYPSEYDTLNLNVIKTLKKEFPEAVIGYSSHENGIVGSVLAKMIGANIFESHFTLNHAWKGTDHKFSLEPQGFHKLTRDLHRIEVALGNFEKRILPEEAPARNKMGKSIYFFKNMKSGETIDESCITIKCPGEGLSPIHYEEILGQKIKEDVEKDQLLTWDILIK